MAVNSRSNMYVGESHILVFRVSNYMDGTRKVTTSSVTEVATSETITLDNNPIFPCIYLTTLVKSCEYIFIPHKYINALFFPEISEKIVSM